MSDRAAFTRAICESPADDTVRLAFADWLDEQDKPADADRAEFIRAQIKLMSFGCTGFGNWPSGTVGKCGCPRCCLVRRDRELLARHAYDWTDPLMRGRSHRVHGTTVRMPSDGVLEFKVTFVRGFIERAACDTAAFVELAEDVFAAHPIREVELIGKDAQDHENWGADGRGFGWNMCGQGLGPRPCDVPYELVAIMRLSPRLLNKGNWLTWADFETAAIALEELCFACVAWGRSLAKLPPLVPDAHREVAV